MVSYHPRPAIAENRKKNKKNIHSPRLRNDILRQKGIIPEKPQDPEPLIQEALVEAEHKAHENRLEDKDLDELDALEDDEDEEFLEQYRYACAISSCYYNNNNI